MLRILSATLAATTLVSTAVADDPAPPVRMVGQIMLVEEVEIPARETGLLEEISVRPGEQIRTGAVLARMDDTEARLRAQQAETELLIAREAAENEIEIQAARKSEDVARAELQRALEAVDKYARSISATELDRLRLVAERSMLLIEQARFQQRAAKLESELRHSRSRLASHIVDRHQIRSPLDGVVVKVSKQKGEWVETGTPMFHVLRLDRLQCEARAASAAISTRDIGRPARVIVQVPGGKPVTLEGIITFVDPRISPIKEDVVVRAEFDNPKLAVLPGMKAEIEFAGPVEAATGETAQAGNGVSR